MSRIVGVTLLLIVLIGSFLDTTAFHARDRSIKNEYRKCRCTLMTSGRRKCPFPLIPSNDTEKQDLKRCLCKNPNKSPRISEMCRRNNGIFVFPVTLL